MHLLSLICRLGGGSQGERKTHATLCTAPRNSQTRCDEMSLDVTRCDEMWWVGLQLFSVFSPGTPNAPNAPNVGPEEPTFTRLELEQRRDEESRESLTRSFCRFAVLVRLSWVQLEKYFLWSAQILMDAGKLLPLHRIGHSARNTCSVLRDLRALGSGTGWETGARHDHDNCNSIEFRGDHSCAANGGAGQDSEL
jgi:hypothetical protein